MCWHYPLVFWLLLMMEMMAMEMLADADGKSPTHWLRRRIV